MKNKVALKPELQAQKDMRKTYIYTYVPRP